MRPTNNKELYEDSVKALLRKKDATELDLLSALKDLTSQPGNYDLWREVIVRLHVTILLDVYTPFAEDSWMKDQREASGSIRQSLSAATDAFSKVLQPGHEHSGLRMAVSTILLEHNLPYSKVLGGDKSSTEIPQPNLDKVQLDEVQLFWELINDYSAVKSLQSGKLVDALEKLARSLETFVVPWRVAHASHLIKSLLLKRKELTLAEWLKAMSLAQKAFESTRVDMADEFSGSHYVVNEPNKVHQIFMEKAYWAWMYGFVSSAGSHLQNEIASKIYWDNWNSGDAEIIRSAGAFPIAVDLVLSHLEHANWPKIREKLGDIWVGVQSSMDEFEDFDLSWGYPLYRIDKEFYWLARIGFVDGMLDKSRGRQLLEGYTSEEQEKTRKISGATLDEFLRLQQGFEQNRRETVEKELKAQIGALWDKLPHDSKIELVEAELLFKEQTAFDWAYKSSQHFVNVVDKLLRDWLFPKAKQYPIIPGERIPKFVGQWARWFEKASSQKLTVKSWPELKQPLVDRLAQGLQVLSKGRAVAHGDRPPIIVDECRSLVLGLNGPGMILLIAQLTGRA